MITYIPPYSIKKTQVSPSVLNVRSRRNNIQTKVINRPAYLLFTLYTFIPGALRHP